MNERDQKAAPGHGDQDPTPEGNDVRATMELTRQALESSAAEIERARRLLRETEELVQLPESLQEEKCREEDEAS